MVGLALAGVAPDGTETGAASWTFAESGNARAVTIHWTVLDRPVEPVAFVR
jgi:hypothetical protein